MRLMGKRTLRVDTAKMIRPSLMMWDWVILGFAMSN